MLHKTVCAVVINYNTSESDVLCSSLVVYFWICMQEGKIGERERENNNKKPDGNGIVVSILEYGSCHIHKLNSHHLLVFCFYFFAFVVFVGLS